MDVHVTPGYQASILPCLVVCHIYIYICIQCIYIYIYYPDAGLPLTGTGTFALKAAPLETP